MPDLPLRLSILWEEDEDRSGGRRGRQDADSSPFSSSDSYYIPGLSQVLVGQEGVFQGTRSRVAILYNYEQSSSSIGVISPEPSKIIFQ